MNARRAVGVARRADDPIAPTAARAAVDRAKAALGERGPVWWHAGAPDLNRRLVAGTGARFAPLAMVRVVALDPPFTPPSSATE